MRCLLLLIWKIEHFVANGPLYMWLCRANVSIYIYFYVVKLEKKKIIASACDHTSKSNYCSVERKFEENLHPGLSFFMAQCRLNLFL